MQATEKQIKYLKYLLSQAGWDTRFVTSAWKPFATMSQRQGRVDDVSFELASSAIDYLKNKLEAK